MRSIFRGFAMCRSTRFRKSWWMPGKVCAAYHDQYVRGLECKRVQCDEIWSFCYSKERNVKGAKAAPEGAGNVWTWTALDADTKLIVTWNVGGDDVDAAMTIMEDLREPDQNPDAANDRWPRVVS